MKRFAKFSNSAAILGLLLSAAGVAAAQQQPGSTSNCFINGSVATGNTQGKNAGTASLYIKRHVGTQQLVPPADDFFTPAESLIRLDSFASGQDRLFNIFSQVVMGTPPPSLRDSPRNDKVAGAFFAFRGSHYSGSITGLNPLVQFDDDDAPAVGIEVDVNAKTDTPLNDDKMHDGIAIASGWVGKPFRALVIAATNSPKNAWRYGIDLHHFTERGIKISDAVPGNGPVGLEIDGGSMRNGIAVTGMSRDQIRIQPSDDADTCVLYVTDASGTKVNSCLYKNGGMRMNVAGVRWSTGDGSPSGSCITGSLYTRTDATGGLYVCINRAWVVK